MATVKKYLAVIGTAIIAVLGVLVWFFKNKANNAQTSSILGNTQGQDKVLKQNQNKTQEEIRQVENQDDSKLSPEDRSKRWNN